MAEETQPKPTEPETAKSEATVSEPTKPEPSVEPKPAEEPTPANVPKPAKESEPSEESKSAEESTIATETSAEEADAAAEAVAEESGVAQSESFKEESNKVADLEDPEKKALDELKQLIQSALVNKEFIPPPPPPAKSEEAKAEEKEVKAEEEAKAEDVKAKEEPAKVEEVKEEKAEEVKVEEPATVEEVKAEEPAKVEEVKTEEPAKTEEVKKEETIEEAKAEVVDVKIEEVKAEEEEAKPTKEKEVALEEGSGDAVEETPAAAEEPEPELETQEEVFIWGVPLLGDVKSDTVLLKFLRARDFKVKDAMTMIKNAVIWRKQFEIEKLLEEDLDISELEKVVFYHGIDKEGHPVCYNVYGEFQDKEFYSKVFGDDEKREKFLRWRIQYLEKGIREKLDFGPEGVSSMVQVTDLKNTPGPGKKELRVATNKALTLLQDNYPEFVAKQIFINVPWWYLAYNRVISPFFTQRTKSKFVFAGPSKSTETLFKYIAPEQVPVQYGGLSKDNDPDFTVADPVTEVTIKPTSKHTVEIPTKEGSVLIWELRVLGWEVSYGAEFSPDAENGYTVIIQKARKFTATDEAYVKNSFKIGEPGKVVLTIDNTSSKKKKLLYRYKDNTATEST